MSAALDAEVWQDEKTPSSISPLRNMINSGSGRQLEFQRLALALGKPLATKPSRIVSRSAGSPFEYDGGTQKTYQRIVQAMDLSIGREIDALQEKGCRKIRFVVFNSDNGGKRFSDTWSITGRKTEGGLRIPAIIPWPARPASNFSELNCTLSSSNSEKASYIQFVSLVRRTINDGL